MIKSVGLTLACLLGVAASGWADDCSCSSPSGVCSASVSCPDGCYASCGSTCSAGCSGTGPGGNVRSPTKALGALSLDAKGASAEEISQLVGEQLGARFAYSSSDILAVDFHRVSVEDLLRVLAQSGAVAVVHPAAEGAADLRTSRLSLRADAVPVSALSEVLSRASDGALTFKPRDPSQEIAIDVKRMPTTDLSRILAGLGQLRVSTSGN